MEWKGVIHIFFLFLGFQSLIRLLYASSRVIFTKYEQTTNISTKRALFKKKGTLYFILGNFEKENNVFVSF